MAPEGGRDGAALIGRLLEEAHRFDFFQAVRVLQRWAAETPCAEADACQNPVGHDFSPRTEAVRLRTLPALGFPPASVAEVRRLARGPDATPAPLEMFVTFMGLIGPQGALPEHYTARVIERARAKDYALRDFLDLFQHRALSLFFRAWEKYRFPLGYERAHAKEGAQEDLFTYALYCLVGLGTGGLRGRMRADDETLLYYGGLFARRVRSAVSLEAMLADYLGLPAEVRQFRGQWLYLAPEDRSLLPGGPGAPGQNHCLGHDVVIGERVWDVQSKFRVRLGPLSYLEFRRFLPDGGRLEPLCDLVRAHAGPQWDFDVQLVLRADEVPWCRLGGGKGDESDLPRSGPEGASHKSDSSPFPSRLGWDSWVRCRPMGRDASEAVFSWEG